MALSFEAWKVGEVAAATVEVPVIVHEVKNSPELLATLRGHTGIVWRVALSSDGKTLASAARDGEVKLWDMASKKERAALESKLGNSYSLAFAPDSKTLATAHHEWDSKYTKIGGGIVLWDVATGKETARLQPAKPCGVSQIAFSSDGKTLAALESHKDDPKQDTRVQIALWDVESGKVRSTIALKDSGSGLTFSPDGKTLALSIMLHEKGRVNGCEVRRWDVASGKALAAWPYPAEHKESCSSLVFSRDGQHLAGANYRGNVLVWDAASGKAKSAWKIDETRSLGSVCFAPDNQTLAVAVGSAGRDPEPGLVVLWDAKEGRRIGTLTGHLGAVQTVAFSPDGKTLVSTSADKTIRLWDMTPRKQVQRATDQ